MEDILTLGMLIMLQAVLGFDNLLYISLESKRVPEEKQAYVRNLGIGIAIFLRIGLLFLIVFLMDLFKNPFADLNINHWISGSFSGESIIVLFGGIFIIYTAIKEIWHMMLIEKDKTQETKTRSVSSTIFLIVVMNLVFSFDSILSAKALTDTMWVLVAAIVISGVLMIWLSGTVSRFLQKNRMYEVLGLFILLLVGIMLVTDGGEKAHLVLFDEPIEAMSTTTFYFVLFIMVLIDIAQSRYQKKLLIEESNIDNKA